MKKTLLKYTRCFKLVQTVNTRNLFELTLYMNMNMFSQNIKFSFLVLYMTPRSRAQHSGLVHNSGCVCLAAEAGTVWCSKHTSSTAHREELLTQLKQNDNVYQSVAVRWYLNTLFWSKLFHKQQAFPLWCWTTWLSNMWTTWHNTKGSFTPSRRGGAAGGSLSASGGHPKALSELWAVCCSSLSRKPHWLSTAHQIHWTKVLKTCVSSKHLQRCRNRKHRETEFALQHLASSVTWFYRETIILKWLFSDTHCGKSQSFTFK